MVAVGRAILHGCEQASHCSGFSCCGAWAQLPGGMWGLNSQTRDQTCALCLGRRTSNQCMTREVPTTHIFKHFIVENFKRFF